MADELTLSAALSFTKGSTTVGLSIGSTTFDVTGSLALHARQTIGGAAEALALGEVAPVGYFIGINRDATSYVAIRPAAGASDMVRLGPGEMALFRVDQNTYATTSAAPIAAIAYNSASGQTTTSGVDLEYVVIED